jgi:hypothetical protein
MFIDILGTTIPMGFHHKTALIHIDFVVENASDIQSVLSNT